MKKQKTLFDREVVFESTEHKNEYDIKFITPEKFIELIKDLYERLEIVEVKEDEHQQKT
ncbi:hypothetical protein PX52LOC_03497 [Limnoglobus roseus]|uniref:Uncharacterized protein n=1 Tax=Limnoglobus roseus TaxID=2598579 RepID=A0A5C1AHU7_9BACT|nr:hypothetical protein PX52LOC_03497 [Limnoglobus roseus]